MSSKQVSFAQYGAHLSTTMHADTVAVHLTDWMNAEYLVATGNSSGCVVALSADGDTLAVGSYGVGSSALGAQAFRSDHCKVTSGTVYVFVRSGGLWLQQACLKGSTLDVDDCFGSAVALSSDGNTLVVGAYQEASDAIGVNGEQTNSLMIASGAVYVFTRVGREWMQQAHIKASNPDSADFFGYAVAVSADGSTVAVGALGESSNATNIDGNQANNSMAAAGAVYTFIRSGTMWSQQAYIKASHPNASDAFGYAIALSADGNTLAVGAYGDNSIKETSGAVYAFTRAGTIWSQQAYLKASNPDPFDSFGSAVALSADGNTLVVGAYGEDSDATGINGLQSNNSKAASGAVYAFIRSGEVWSQQAYIKAAKPNVGDYFGYAIALSADGNTLVAGACGDATNAGVHGIVANGFNAVCGAVYGFKRRGTRWSQQAYLKAWSADISDSAAGVVALSADGGSLATVGSYRESDAIGLGDIHTNRWETDAGSAYSY
jgi:trimeric autotransporter adhesin